DLAFKSKLEHGVHPFRDCVAIAVLPVSWRSVKARAAGETSGGRLGHGHAPERPKYLRGARSLIRDATILRRSRCHVGLLAALRRSARYHEIRDDDLNGLIVLVERRRSHLDPLLVDPQPTGAKRLANGKVFEESPTHVH